MFLLLLTKQALLSIGFNPYFNFVIDGKITNWDIGFVYFADTTKEHYLFNGGGHPSYWIILNIENKVENVRKVLNNLWVRV